MRYVGRQNFIMPTTCAVVGCHNRQSKYSKLSFCRFPKEEERHRRWIAFVSRKNSDGLAWEPGNGDRICSQHFIKGKKSDLYTNPNYVPSIQAKNSPDLNVLQPCHVSNVLAIAPNCRWNEEGKKRELPWSTKCG